MAGVIPAIFASALLFPNLDKPVVWTGRECTGVASRSGHIDRPGAATVYPIVFVVDYLFQLLLHRADVQSARSRRQPKTRRGLSTGNSSRRAHRQIHRQRDDSTDADRWPLHDCSMPFAAIFKCVLKCSFLSRWYFAAYCGGGNNGFYVSSAVTFDVASIFFFDEEV